MKLFESKAERDAREKVAMNMGRKKIRDYLARCRSSSSKYREMAKKALELGNRHQAEHFVASHLQYSGQSKRWESFMMKLDDIQLRSEAMGAMTGLMEGMSSMCSTISRGISAEEIQKTMVRLQTGMNRVDEAEAQVIGLMDNLSFNVGPDSFETSYQELPSGLQEEIGDICSSLMDELQVEGSVESVRNRQAIEQVDSTKEAFVEAGDDSRLERLKQLRKHRQTP